MITWFYENGIYYYCNTIRSYGEVQLAPKSFNFASQVQLVWCVAQIESARKFFNIHFLAENTGFLNEYTVENFRQRPAKMWRFSGRFRESQHRTLFREDALVHLFGKEFITCNF